MEIAKVEGSISKDLIYAAGFDLGSRDEVSKPSRLSPVEPSSFAVINLTGFEIQERRKSIKQEGILLNGPVD